LTNYSLSDTTLQCSELFKLDTFWNPKLVIDNAVGDLKENTSTSIAYDEANGEAFIFERRRMKGTFLENLELFHFPFDIQVPKVPSENGILSTFG
jgi:hypothetical protein